MKLDRCPICSGKLKVARLKCQGCGAAIEAEFATSCLLNLPATYQEFIEWFVLSSGSLKEMSQRLGVSYPTVRARLDEIISALREEIKKKEEYKKVILDKVEKGQISPEEAADIIKEL